MKTEFKPKTIEEIIEMKRNDVLKINAEYQRGDVWAKRQKILLIDSIMRGYPIPLFYFHISPKELKEFGGYGGGKWPEIIDGQQRINAIYEFGNDAFALFDPNKKGSGIPQFLHEEGNAWAGKKFSQFNAELRKQFLSTELRIAEIHTSDENQARDLFVRLQGGLPLTPQEKRDAWPGEFTAFILNTAGKKDPSNTTTLP